MHHVLAVAFGSVGIFVATFLLAFVGQAILAGITGTPTSKQTPQETDKEAKAAILLSFTIALAVTMLVRAAYVIW